MTKQYFIIGWAYAETSVGTAKVIDCFNAKDITAARKHLAACKAQNDYRNNYRYLKLVETKAEALTIRGTK